MRVQGILSQVESPRPSFFPSQHTTFTALIAKYPTVFQSHLSCNSTVRQEILMNFWFSQYLIRQTL